MDALTVFWWVVLFIVLMSIVDNVLDMIRWRLQRRLERKQALLAKDTTIVSDFRVLR